MISLKHFFVFLFFVLFTISLNASESKKIFSLVSDRSVSSLNQAALYHLKKSDDSISIRTVSQVLNMSEYKLQEQISKADIVLFTSVFGDIVEKLLTKDYSKNKLVISLQGDRRLLSLTKDISSSDFKNIPHILLSKNNIDDSYLKFLTKKQKEFPSFAFYLQARAYWDNRGIENISNLFSFLSKLSLDKSTWPKIKELKSIRYFLNANASKTYEDIKTLSSSIDSSKNILFVLDNDRADSTSSWKIHEALSAKSNLQVISVLSSWGKASFDAVKSLEELVKTFPSSLKYSIISMQDFVIGAGDARVEVLKSLERLNVPVLKGLRVLDINANSYKFSSQGLPVNSVHYRISMPELQGIGQVHILAMSDSLNKNEITGANIYDIKLMEEELLAIIKKAKSWMNLKTKKNKDKKLAIIYYNHPPGRHNIGADNLNVPSSLFEMLKNLKAQGYEVGTLPKDEEELLDLLQEKAVNLPNDKKALEEQSQKVAKVTLSEYKQYFNTLPLYIQAEMKSGPLMALDTAIKTFINEDLKTLKSINKKEAFSSIHDYLQKTISNLHHALDGVRSKSRQRAINLLEQLKLEYIKILKLSQEDNLVIFDNANSLVKAIIDMQIEGLRGWGELPGTVMTWKDDLLIPSVNFGNIILAPQPPRGWELNEELLHANLSFPPTHQYLAFYFYMKKRFKADAIIHVGRHSTYEFLPRKSIGLSASDYPSLIIEDLPSIYPYIVDGVGEGIQAKRRGQAIIIDHLTPPLATTKLYDNLLTLRQLIESAEAASDEIIRKDAIKKIRLLVDKMDLRAELIESMDEELKVRGIGFDEVDDEFLLHEVGHYLTHLQEEFMPLGLHTFGKNWNKEAVDTMIKSMQEDELVSKKTKENLIISPSEETKALLNALEGGFITSGKGNDPIRTHESLPTGRNFYAIDGSLIPSSIGYEIGVKLAQKVVVKKTNNINKKEAVILWASDTVRDEGAMIAFGFDLLGVKPIWNSRGILKGLKRLPLDEKRKYRLDVVFTASGLFRDLYGSQLQLLDKAVLLALDAAYNTIIKKYPVLTLSLDSALQSLGELKKGGDESLEENAVAANWVKEARELLKQNPSANLETIGKKASFRVFATAPGAYGAGINRLVERSSSWKKREELANVFIKRMSYSYSNSSNGILAVDSFKRQLKDVENTYLGRASNLYGLIDNNDTFDYLGGLNLAIESIKGEQPNSFVINHSNTNNLRIDGLQTALLSEIRGRFLNPQWIKPLMKEGYSGARTMGNEFIEYLWGWQVTSPEIITDKVWEDVKAVYIDDKLNLKLDEFLSSNHQVHVQTNILAVMLVAIEKDFWKADDKTIKQLSNQFAQNIIENGIPGSGHTHANHPIYDFVKKQISEELGKKLQEKVNETSLDKQDLSVDKFKTIQEVNLDDKQKEEQIKKEEVSSQKEKNQSEEQDSYLKYLLIFAGLILFLGLLKSIFFNKAKGA